MCTLTLAPPKTGTPEVSPFSASRYASTSPQPPAEVQVPRDVPLIDGGHYAPASTPTRRPAASFEVQKRPPGASTAPTAKPAPFARVARPAGPLPRAAALARGSTPPSAMPQPAEASPPPPGTPSLALPPPASPDRAPAAPVPPDGAPVASAASAAPVLVPPGQSPAPAAHGPAPSTAPPLPPVEVVEPALPSADEVRARKRAMPVVKPRTLEVIAAVDHGQRPEPGLQEQAFYWDTDGDPPAAAKEGEGGYVVYHSIDIDADVRIAYQTLVRVRAPRRRGATGEDNHKVVVDDRVSVQKRALLTTMDAVRAKADQAARRSREKLARKLARRRARVVRWPRALAPLGFAVVRAQARLGHGIINTKRGLRRGLVEVPDHLASATLRVQYNLSSPLGRKALVEGLRNPNSMNQDQRSAVIILTLVATAALVLLSNSIIALATPQYADVYRNLLKDAALQLIGLFGAPIPIEPFFIFTLLSYGAVVAFTGFFLGKMLGAWILILLGESLHEHLNKTIKGQRTRRMLDWLKVNANKYGFTILVLDNAIPFAPDQLMLVFAVTGMRTRDWMLGIALGTAIKLGAMILAVDYYGPEYIEFFFEHPLEYFQGQRPAATH